MTNVRDQHLFSKGKKRILSLDGGGVRGAISIAFLEKLEEILSDIEGKHIFLCDWFDMIGGTSTGAIIAAALAKGFRSAEIKAFYKELAPKVFKNQWFRIPGIQSSFDAEILKVELEKVFTGLNLDSDQLRTGLLLVLKRLDTGSSWIVVNNPNSKYWETPADLSFIGNKHLSLSELIRASAAAPYYFDPQLIEIIAGQEPGLFLDGGVTPHNNPSLAILLSCVLPPYGLNWSLSESELSILSVGTGSFRPKVTAQQSKNSPALKLAVDSLAALITDNQELVLTVMSWLGNSCLPWKINSEIDDMSTYTPHFGSLFNYTRCDIMLEPEWLNKNLNTQFTSQDVEMLRAMDKPENIETLYSCGRIAAAKQLKHEMFINW